MNQFKNIIHEAERLKKELNVLNSFYDDLYKPWILVSDDHRHRYNIDDKNDIYQPNDLKFLYKLEQVLISANDIDEKRTNAKEISILESHNRKNTTASLSRRTPAASSKSLVKVQPVERKRTKPSCDRTFIPAHISAPFKTDPSLHIPRIKINYPVRRGATNTKTTTLRTLSTPPGSHQGTIKQKPLVRDRDALTNGINEPEMDNGTQIDIREGESVMLSQLREEIKRLEVADERAPEIVVVTTTRKTVFEAGTDLQVPKDLKKELATNAKLLSQVGHSFLQSMNTETRSTGSKARQRFIESISGESGRCAVENHRVRVLETVLDSVAHFAASLDLPSCSSLQLAFLRACLSWALTEFTDITSHVYPPSGEVESATSDKIRMWLHARRKKEPEESTLWRRAKEVSCVTNCCFVSAAPARGRHPVSLALHRFRPSIFLLSIDSGTSGLLVPCPYERQTRLLVAQLQMQLSWGPMIGLWTQRLRDKQRLGDNPCSFYRRLYGLLLRRYPVLLRDVS